MPVTRIELLDHVESSFDSAPVSRDDLLRTAQTSGARTEVLDILNRLPNDEFKRPQDLWGELPDLPIGA